MANSTVARLVSCPHSAMMSAPRLNSFTMSDCRPLSVRDAFVEATASAVAASLATSAAAAACVAGDTENAHDAHRLRCGCVRSRIAASSSGRGSAPGAGEGSGEVGTARSDTLGSSSPSGAAGVTTATGAPGAGSAPPGQHASHTRAPGGSSRPEETSTTEDGTGAPESPQHCAHAASASHFTVAAGAHISCTSRCLPGVSRSSTRTVTEKGSAGAPVLAVLVALLRDDAASARVVAIARGAPGGTRGAR